MVVKILSSDSCNFYTQCGNKSFNNLGGGQNKKKTFNWVGNLWFPAFFFNKPKKVYLKKNKKYKS